MNDLPLHFLLEVALRTFVMFVVILITLRVSGKRGIKQLSVFELVLIIGLGSAAGDPMFYEDVGLLPAFVVFAMVILLYVLVTKITDKVRWAEKLLEGEPAYLMKDGNLLVKELERSNLSREELFAELRLLNVEHLGQVRTVVLETSGELSVLFYEKDDVKLGLPIFPGEGELLKNAVTICACSNCGYVTILNDAVNCPMCNEQDWRVAYNTKRVS